MTEFSIKEINNKYLSLLNSLIKGFNKNDNCVYNTDIGNFLDIKQYIIDNTGKDLIMKNVQFI